MVEYQKIKNLLAKATNHKEVDDLLLETIKHRDQLNEIIELALDKQAVLSTKPSEKY